ncbi:acylneuraminate cytidylyltransferase family protein [Neobacillus niacini]|uniref:acylneuraminate cytidylyltransferase family protein n=1 Tax=Neobacillus niacini TaxID=86668 RepID=UPI003000ED7E
MYQNKRFIAIIPARGGSKGIPNKNIIDVNGKPLIQYSIDAAKASKYIDSIVVSTDSVEIAEVAAQCGADIPALRPEYLASDKAKTIDALLHMVEVLRRVGEEFDYLVLLQPTQPLRQGFHIDEAIETMMSRNSKSLVSISKVNEHPVLMRTQNLDGTLKNILNVSSTIRRQDFPDFYKVNGAIYINALDHTFNQDTSLNDNEIGYAMDSKYDVDIDEPIDLEIAKIKLNHLELQELVTALI